MPSLRPFPSTYVAQHSYIDTISREFRMDFFVLILRKFHLTFSKKTKSNIITSRKLFVGVFYFFISKQNKRLLARNAKAESSYQNQLALFGVCILLLNTFYSEKIALYTYMSLLVDISEYKVFFRSTVSSI